MALTSKERKKIIDIVDAVHLMLAIAGVGLIICSVVRAFWGFGLIPWWAYIIAYLLLGVQATIDTIGARTERDLLRSKPSILRSVAMTLFWPYIDITAWFPIEH